MGFSSSHWTVDSALGVEDLLAVAAQPQLRAASGFSAFAAQIHSLWSAHWALRQRVQRARLLVLNRPDERLQNQ